MANVEPKASNGDRSRPWLRAWREAKGLSRPALAVRLDASADSVRRWEEGASVPQHRFQEALAKEMDITVAELRKRLGQPPLTRGNVVALPTATPQESSSIEHVPDDEVERLFDTAVLKGIELGHATSPHWNEAVARYAARRGLPW